MDQNDHAQPQPRPYPKSGRNEVLSTVLYSYWNSGKAQYATAIAVSLMVILGGLVLLTGRLSSQRAVVSS